MKIIKPGSYSEIIDKKTNKTIYESNKNSVTIEYTNQELDNWLNYNQIPKDIAKHGIKFFKRIEKIFKTKQDFFKNNPNATEQDYINWAITNTQFSTTSTKKSKKEEDFFKFILDNAEQLKKTLDIPPQPETFPIPSVSIMLSLLAMFAGKVKYIPRKSLEKPANKRTVKEQKEADDYLSNIFRTEYDYSNLNNQNQPNEKKIAIVCNNHRVKGEIEIDPETSNNPSFREEQFAIHLKKTFSVEGIRHLLGYLIGLEENSRQGYFHWEVNEHLAILGYEKTSNGSYDAELKRTACAFVKNFSSFCITTIQKEGKNNATINNKYLFNIEEEEFDVQLLQKDNSRKNKTFTDRILV